MDAPTIELGETSATLEQVPHLAALSLSRTGEQLQAADLSLYVALGAAALYLAWPSDRTWPTRPRPRAWRAGQRIQDYGHEIFDALAEVEGLSGPELIEACGAAYHWSQFGRLTQEEVTAAADFFEPPQGG